MAQYVPPSIPFSSRAACFPGCFDIDMASIPSYSPLSSPNTPAAAPVTTTLLTVLLCLETDKRIHLPWVAIWTPLWCLDAVLLFMLWFLVAMGRSQPPEGLEEEEEWRGNDDFPRRLLDALQFSCNVLFQVFLTLKLDETVPWDWSVSFFVFFLSNGVSLLGPRAYVAIDSLVVLFVASLFVGFITLGSPRD